MTIIHGWRNLKPDALMICFDMFWPSKIEVDLVICVGLSSWSFEICHFLTNPLRDTLNSNCENCGRIWAVVGSDYIWPSDSLHEGSSGVGNPQIEESSAVSQALRSLSKMLDVQTDCSNLAQLPNLHFVSAPQTGACLLAGSVFTVLLCFTLSFTISHRNLSSAEVGWGHAHFLTSLCLHHEGQAAAPQGGAQTRRRGFRRVRDGAQLAETEMGSERRSIYQAQVESFLEDGSRSKSTRFPCLPTKHDGKVLDISLRIDISTRKKNILGVQF